jgi:hypothetical protein
MERTRIRWGNLGRLVGGLGAGGLLLFVVPGLIQAPEPPPLAADVGLTSGATGAYADATSPREPARRHPRVREAESRRGFGDRSRSRRRDPERERGATDRPPDSRLDSAVGNPPSTAPPLAPAPPPLPVASPAPPAAPALPAPAPPEPEAPTPSPPEPEEPEPQPPSAPNPPPPSGPSQFGFEH